MVEILEALLWVLKLYTYMIIIMAIMSWLISFNVINLYNKGVRTVWDLLTALTEPLLRPIRNLLPNMNGLDLSPVVLLLLIFVVEKIIVNQINSSLGF